MKSSLNSFKMEKISDSSRFGLISFEKSCSISSKSVAHKGERIRRNGGVSLALRAIHVRRFFVSVSLSLSLKKKKNKTREEGKTQCAPPLVSLHLYPIRKDIFLPGAAPNPFNTTKTKKKRNEIKSDDDKRHTTYRWCKISASTSSHPRLL